MNLSSILGINHLPTLDLHGYDRESARVAINDFVLENYKLKNATFVIVHGVGTGVLKRTTTETLRKHRLVLHFGIHYFNEGCTVVQIKLD